MYNKNFTLQSVVNFSARQSVVGGARKRSHPGGARSVQEGRWQEAGPSSSGAQSKSRKPPKYPRTQSKSCGPQRCTICGGNHEPRTCDQQEGKCFTCGQAGHISRYCLVKASPAPSVTSAPATPAHYGGVPPAASSAGRAMVLRQPEATRSAPSRRVFAAQTQADEPAEAEDRHVLAGMVLINEVRSRAMFDTGATHSFISRSFARMHDIELQESKSTWRVSGPGRDFLVRKECSTYPVRLGDWIMPIRMLVLKKLKDFDVILRMDWLSKYYATIHCRNKVITFREPGQEEFTYRACRSSYFAATVSATRARKLLTAVAQPTGDRCGSREDDSYARGADYLGSHNLPSLSPDVLVRLRLTSTRRCETRLASPSSRPWLSRDSSHTSGSIIGC
uniref:CCHC-type domain-containing protein n=1 Tax=Ananas comosus var. bracteatus TaxID=296719 RepID=A0A6V7Q3D3_ANACO|nr:unnamed protein product [Ananas comosus var. bracteatus]